MLDSNIFCYLNFCFELITSLITKYFICDLETLGLKHSTQH